MITTTTIAVPTSCAALCIKFAELSQRIEDELAQAGSGAVIDYGSIEQRVADALGEIERGLHAQILAHLDIDVPAIRVWGDEYRRIGRFESDYHTLAGTVRVMRTVYRKTERNGDTLTVLRHGSSRIIEQPEQSGLDKVRTAPMRSGAVRPQLGSTSQYENHPGRRGVDPIL